MSGQHDRRGERLVRLAVAEDPVSAEVWRDALAQAGIRSLVRNVDTLAAWSGGAALTLELLVLEGDLEAARAIVNAEPAEPILEPRHHRPRRWRRVLRRGDHRASEPPQ
ncbi:MAG TPA: DUF2007 domain-containing protein [Dehalococcoidia bacterium]|nr:DUF2007 domain-containing protein [Dehalococcoidia bacterium]